MNAQQELKDILSSFERGAGDLAALAANLQAWYARADTVPGTVIPPPGGLLSDVDELIARLDMIELSVCRAERRGAVLELVREFRERL